MPNTAMNPQSVILYVAKESVERGVLIDAIRKAGFKIREATTGSEALAGLAQSPDLILLSVDLTDLNGFEVCRRLKADPALAAIPVVLMSATFAEAAERQQALASGADDYVIEPVEPTGLLSQIKALLFVQRGEGET